MKAILDFSIKAANLSLLFLSLIFASCHTNRQVSDYPNFKSPDKTKFGLQSKRLKTHSHQNIKLAPKPDSISYYTSLEKIKIQKDTEVDSNSHVAAKEYISLISRKSELPRSMNNQGALIASLSVEPLITRFSFYPDTNKINNNPTSDTNIKKNTKSPDLTLVKDKNNYSTEKRNNKIYTYCFLGSVLLAIVLLIFGLPLSNLFILSALVFGALRLKLFRKKKGTDKKTNTRLGCFIGIGLIAAVFIALFIVILVGLSHGE